MAFWVYILHCADGSYYTGHTDSLEKRIGEHTTGAIDGCYTFKRRPVELVFSQEFKTREEALSSEQQIKGWSRKKKEAMMRGDWAEVSRLARSSNPVRPELRAVSLPNGRAVEARPDTCIPVRPEPVEGRESFRSSFDCSTGSQLRTNGKGASMKKGWQTRSLGDLCQMIGGGTPSKDKTVYYSGDIPWATVRDMRSEVITQTECQITKEAVRCSATNIIPRGNVVIATRVGLGKVCLLGQDTAINQDLRGIVPIDPKVLSVRFLFWWLKSISDSIVTEGTGATVQGVKLPFVKSLQLPLPPLPEQQRIVGILDEAFDGIATAKANAEKNLQNARALFESHLQSVFTQRGEGWVETTLGVEYDVRDGTHDSPKYHATGYPLITSKNLKREGLSFDDVKLISEQDYRKINERSAVHKGDVLFAMIGTIGNPTLVAVEPNFAIKNVALFKMRQGQSGSFLMYYLGSSVVITKMMGEAKGTTQKFVGLGYLRSFPINLPPFAEQIVVVEKLAELEEETQRLESIYQQKLTALEALEKSLLNDAFMGAL